MTTAQMITVKVTMKSGNSFKTGINATLDEAKAYYIGRDYITEDDSGKETYDRMVSVELVGGAQ